MQCGNPNPCLSTACPISLSVWSIDASCISREKIRWQNDFIGPRIRGRIRLALESQSKKKKHTIQYRAGVLRLRPNQSLTSIRQPLWDVLLECREVYPRVEWWSVAWLGFIPNALSRVDCCTTVTCLLVRIKYVSQKQETWLEVKKKQVPNYNKPKSGFEISSRFCGLGSRDFVLMKAYF